MILRMTLGRAARSRSRRATHWQRCGSAQKVSAASSRHDGAIDQHLQPEVREGVGDHARHAPTSRPRTGAAAQRLVERRQRLGPLGRGHLQHAAEQAGLGPPPQQHVRRPRASARKASPTRTGRSGLAARAGSALSMPLRSGRRSRPAAGTSGTRGAWACRRWRRGPSAPGRNRRRAWPASACAASRLISGLAAGSGCLHREQPRHHPLDVAVDRRRARAPKAMAAMAAAV